MSDEHTESALERSQDAIDEARSAVPDALPSDPLEGVRQDDDVNDDSRTAEQLAEDEELED